MISSIGMLIGAVFLVVPLLVAYVYQATMTRQLLVALCRMLLRLGVLGVLAYYLVEWDSVALDIVFLVLMVAYSTVSVLVKSRLRVGRYGVTVFSGMIVSTTLTACCLLIIFACSGNTLSTRLIVPAIALMAGGIVDGQSKALGVYYCGLLNHNQLYYYLIGNGATRSEALHYLMRRAIQKSLAPGISRMAGLAVGVVPLVMWAMVVCGASVADAVALQILLVLASLFASVVAVVVTLVVARRYSLDAYGRIRDTSVKPTAATNGSPTSASSGSPAAASNGSSTVASNGSSTVAPNDSSTVAPNGSSTVAPN